ncbi:MAG TPA: hypothetical protein VFB07_11985 [Vicinamibacterales bacterium]|nr:hypothetical protein [Vicinamibacterales bacterium]
MDPIRDLLKDADPVRHETIAPADRERARRAVLAAAEHPHARPSSVGRRVVLAAAVTAIAGGAVAGGKRWLGATTVHAAAVRFEARLAETTPTLDLQPVRVAPDRTIYLHRDVIVTNDDVVAARVVPGNAPGRFAVAVTLTRSGGEKMRAATAAHIGRPLALLVDGVVVMAPTVRSAIAAEAVLSGDYTHEEAARIAEGMLVR